MATKTEKKQKLILNEKIPLQRAIWTAERVAWGLMLLFVLAALFGALSLGLLSKTETASPDGAVRVSHERILRLQRAYDLVVTREGLEPGGEIGVALSGLDPEAFSVEQVTPEPSGHEAGRGEMLLRFNAGADGSFEATIRIRPEAWGSRSLVVSSPGAPPLTIRFFVLP